MLQLIDITKRFGDTPVLAGFNLRIAAGKTTILIGPSGCGKSTVLRLMTGLIRPDAGEVRVHGTRLTDENVDQLRHHMGYVIQDGGLFPHLTARGNVTLLARHLGQDEVRMEERLRGLAGLTHFPFRALDRYPAQLSGGQCQRVSLMRALMLDPDLLLMDEPLGALDPMIRSGLQQELRAIFRQLGKTVVMVTHDLAEAEHLGERIVLLRAGRIVQNGSLRELIDSPADRFVTEFVAAQRHLA